LPFSSCILLYHTTLGFAGVACIEAFGGRIAALNYEPAGLTRESLSFAPNHSSILNQVGFASLRFCTMSVELRPYGEYQALIRLPRKERLAMPTLCLCFDAMIVIEYINNESLRLLLRIIHVLHRHCSAFTLVDCGWLLFSVCPLSAALALIYAVKVPARAFSPPVRSRSERAGI
jgi:hypothetical protein